MYENPLLAKIIPFSFSVSFFFLFFFGERKTQTVAISNLPTLSKKSRYRRVFAPRHVAKILFSHSQISSRRSEFYGASFSKIYRVLRATDVAVSVKLLISVSGHGTEKSNNKFTNSSQSLSSWNASVFKKIITNNYNITVVNDKKSSQLKISSLNPKIVRESTH